MKNIVISVILFSTLLYSCKNERSHIEKTSNVNSDRPIQAISYPDMASMFKEYDNGQKIVLDEYITDKTAGKDSIATISQFFSISEIKQYIAYIERLSEEKKIDLTGIRIFTSAYPSDYKIKEYQNRVSFILAPTTDIGVKKNVAYEPLQSAIGKPVSMKSVLDKYADDGTKKVNRASFFNVPLLQNDLSSALNRGQIVPPY
jgi:hypothetical protein